jgi:transcription antitermination protein NusB
MSQPHPHAEARRCALDILFQIDIRTETADDAMADWIASGREVPDFARELVLGVTEHREDLDKLIGDYAEEWTVERMAVVDRNILRLAVYELAWRNDTPPKVVINEAIEIAKKFGTRESSRFINGILDRVHRELRPAS